MESRNGQARPANGERATMRAYCQHCDQSEQLAPEEIYSPEFNFWCPRCQSILILQDDGQVLDDDGAVADAITKVDREDEEPARLDGSGPATRPGGLDRTVTEPDARTSPLPAPRPPDRNGTERNGVDLERVERRTRSLAVDAYDALAAELGAGLMGDEVLRPTARLDASRPQGNDRDRKATDVLPRTRADAEPGEDNGAATHVRKAETTRMKEVRAGERPPASKPADARPADKAGETWRKVLDTARRLDEAAPPAANGNGGTNHGRPRTATKRTGSGRLDRQALSEVIAPGAPPLPNWDGGDTQAVRELAASRPEAHDGTVPAPLPDDEVTDAVPGPTTEVDAGFEEPHEADALDEIAIVQPTRGTTGLGSRTYEQAPVAAAAEDLPGPASSSEAPASADPRPAAPTGRAETAAASAATSEDLDWYALIDEALPESNDQPDDDASRVVIRLPENMAPQNEADAEQVRQLQATLEARGVAGADLRPAGRLDPTRLGQADDEDEVAPRSADDDTRSEFRGVRKEVAGVAGEASDPDAPTTIQDPAATAAIRKALQDEAASARSAGLPSGDKGDQTLRVESSSRVGTSRHAIRPQPASIVEQFNRADLDPGLVCARDSSSPEADYFKQLYQRIFHSRGATATSGGPPRTILVTSASKGEGKTTVAANLAVVAARMPGRGALLIEADPRGGDLLRAFGVRMKPDGLLEALQSGKDPAEFILQFKLGMLDVLPLGVPGSDAAELICSDRIGEVLRGLAAHYPSAVVIVDGSSILHAPDPLVLARHVDGVVLVVRADTTPREHVERARDLIGADKVLGVVLNHAQPVAV